MSIRSDASFHRAAVSSVEAPAPAFAYSPAVEFGNLLFVSGQVPVDPRTGKVPSEFSARVRQALESIAGIASAAGAKLSDAVKVGVHLAGGALFEEMDTVYRSYFAEPLPARTTLVAGLRGFAVEIDAIIAVSANEQLSTDRA